MTNYFKRILFDFIANVLAPQFWVPGSLRKHLYKAVGINVHTSAVKRYCYINSSQVSIGEGSFINSFTKLFSAYYKDGYITIGKNCFIGMDVLLCTITHEVGDENKRAGKDKYLPIVVEDGCWIGAKSTILPGVTIGKGTIIAAGSTVTKNCEPNSLYAGTPARKIKDLT